MTEKKRFVIKTVEEDCIFDNRDCKYYDELGMTIALLNELSDENGQLDTKCSQLEKENEQLKKELDKIKMVNELLSMDFANTEHELWKENEQLKQSLHNKMDSDAYWEKKAKQRVEELEQELESERQYILYLKSVLEDNEIWYE